MPSSNLVQKGPELREGAAARSRMPKTLALSRALVGVFWVGYFILIWQVIDPSLRIHNSSVHFYATSESWQEALAKPGGLLEYVASWVALADWSPALGALVATALALSLSYLTRSLARRADHFSASYLALAPPFLLLLQHANYEARPGQTAVGLLLVLSGNWMMMLLSRKPAMVQVVLFSILALGFHHLTGIGSGLFAAWSVVLALVGRKWLLAGVYILLAAVLPLLGVQFVYPAAPPGVWMKLFWPEPQPWLLSAWLGIPLCSLILHFVPVFKGRNWVGGDKFSIPIRAVCYGLILFLPWIRLNRDQRAWLLMDQAAHHRQWDKVLVQAQHLPLRKSTLPAVVAWIQANRALYHKDRLLVDLFKIPQKRGFPLLPVPNMGFGIGAAMSDIFLEMGQVNYSEHWAHEALELLGDKPHLLLRLAAINQLHERPNAARVFLGCLARNPAWRSTAEARLASLRADPLGIQDAELSKIRPLMPRTDIASSYLDTETLLDQLLQANPQNRMAFEYLMAHYLLSMQPREILKRLAQFQTLRYSRLPRLIEEAILFQQTLQAGQDADLAGYPISPETQRDYTEFVRMVKAYTENDVSTRNELGRRFGRTYWFYGVFGQNSAVAALGSQTTGMP